MTFLSPGQIPEKPQSVDHRPACREAHSSRWREAMITCFFFCFGVPFLGLLVIRAVLYFSLYTRAPEFGKLQHGSAIINQYHNILGSTMRPPIYGRLQKHQADPKAICLMAETRTSPRARMVCVTNMYTICSIWQKAYKTYSMYSTW